jgi:hypothetical protein
VAGRVVVYRAEMDCDVDAGRNGLSWGKERNGLAKAGQGKAWAVGSRCVDPFRAVVCVDLDRRFEWTELDRRSEWVQKGLDCRFDWE